MYHAECWVLRKQGGLGLGAAPREPRAWWVPSFPKASCLSGTQESRQWTEADDSRVASPSFLSPEPKSYKSPFTPPFPSAHGQAVSKSCRSTRSPVVCWPPRPLAHKRGICTALSNSASLDVTLKSAVVGVFTPQKWANWAFFPLRATY